MCTSIPCLSDRSDLNRKVKELENRLAELEARFGITVQAQKDEQKIPRSPPGAVTTPTER